MCSTKYLGSTMMELTSVALLKLATLFYRIMSLSVSVRHEILDALSNSSWLHRPVLWDLSDH